MTQIIYTISLVNSDGQKASASTEALEYPETPSRELKAHAKHTVLDLARSHKAMNAMIQQAIANGQTEIPAKIEIAAHAGKRR